MATVPRYGVPEQRPAVRPAARVRPLESLQPAYATPAAMPISANAPTDAFVLGGEGAGKAARTLIAVYEEEKRKADQIALVEADGKLTSGSNNILYDPGTGAMNRKGKDAFGLPNEVLEQYDKLAADIGETLSTPEQRAAFQRLSTMRRVETERAVQRYTSGQIAAHDKEVTESLITSERRAAFNEFLDEGRINASIARQKAVLFDHAGRNGLPPEWVKAKTEEAESMTHTGVISRMLANNLDRAAKAYYELHKEGITGDQKAKVEKAIEEGSTLGESQRQADIIIGMGLGRGASADKAREIGDPKVRQETTKILNEHFSTKERAEKETEDKNYKTAANIVETSRTTAAIPPSIWAELPIPQRSSLEAWAKHLRGGTEPTTDDRAWLEFEDLRPEDLAKMSGEDLHAKYRTKLNNTDWKNAVKKWSGARDIALGRVKIGSEKYSAVQSDTDIIRDAFVLNIVPKKYRPAGKSNWKNDEVYVSMYARMEGAAAQEIGHFEQTKLEGKRKATMEEKRKIVADLISRKVFVEEWGADPQKPSVLVTEDERANVYVPMDRIPPSSRKELLNLARSIGAVKAGLSDSEAMEKLKDRLQKAYGAALIKASDEEIMRILRGGR